MDSPVGVSPRPQRRRRFGSDKARDLLRSRGFELRDELLTSRSESDRSGSSAVPRPESQPSQPPSMA